MHDNYNDQSLGAEATCGLLLLELQKIWDEVGQNEVRRDEMLLEIEEECLEVYERKVDKAKECRSGMRREIASIEAEIEGIRSTLGEPLLKNEKKNETVTSKERIETINPLLVEMRKKKAERKQQFLEILNELKSISKEIFGPTEDSLNAMTLDDLSLKRLEELKNQLREFKAEKSNRLKQVLGLVDNLNSLCLVLGMDFTILIQKIHPTFDETNEFKLLSDDAIMRLTIVIESLRDVKIQRMQRLQDLGTALLDLWNLMEIPIEGQQKFFNFAINVTVSEPDIIEPNMLSEDLIKHAEVEVLRLEKLKSGKVKEIILKKRSELEEICRNSHIVPASCVPEYSVEGDTDLMHALEEIDLAIAKVKEESWSRKEILDKIEKWLAACEEESWLENYNRDDNRYNAGRGAHLTLKRAEKARAAINKIPAMVETLTSKIKSWEKEKGIQFLYDDERVLSRLEQYINLKKEKEQEKQRQRDQKKLQVQRIAEQEVLFGAKPSPSRSGMKGCRTSVGGSSDRKLSLGGSMLQSVKADKRMSTRIHPIKKGDCMGQKSVVDSQHGGFASQFSGRRSSELGDHLVKNQHSTRTRQSESILIRKPLSPIPLSMCSKINIENFPEEQKVKREEISQTLPGTPNKPIYCKEEENRTLKTHPIQPVTPTTTTLPPLLMASTPATPYLTSSAKSAKRLLQNNE